jgi:hypothetical protein
MEKTKKTDTFAGLLEKHLEKTKKNSSFTPQKSRGIVVIGRPDMNPQEWNPLNPQSIRKLTQESQDQVNGWRI